MTKQEINPKNVKSLAIAATVEHWRIEQVLGQTRSGFLYLAHNQKTDDIDFLYEYFPAWVHRRLRSLAPQITNQRKSLFQTGLEQFLLQAHGWSQIQDIHHHPVIHYGEHHGTAIMVTTCGAGHTLSDRIASQAETVDEQQLRLYLQTGLRALHALSQARLSHCDISPQTIFLPELGNPCLLAFGVTGISTGCEPLTYYQPIEIAHNSSQQYPQSDLYSLGASLYHAMTGQPPIMAATRMEAITSGQDDPMIPAVEIGHGRYNHTLTGAIDWMLSPLLRDRPEYPDTLLGQIIRPAPIFHLIDEESDPAVHDKTPAQQNVNNDKLVNSGKTDEQTPVISQTPLPKVTPSIINPVSTVNLPKRKSTFGLLTLTSIIILLVTAIYFFYRLDGTPNPHKNSTITEFKSITDKANAAAVNTDLPPIHEGLPIRKNDQLRISTYRKMNLEDTVRKEIEQQMAADAAIAEKTQALELAREEEQRQIKIRQLWEKINLARAEGHYLWPHKNSVKELLDAIKILQSDNTPIIQFEQDLSCWLLSLADFYRLAGEPHQTYLTLLAASAFNADETLLIPALERIKTAQDPAQQEKDPRIRQLLANARLAFSRDHWFTPPGGNALGMFRTALNMDPGNIAARDGLRHLYQQLKYRFIQSIRQSNKITAMRRLTGLQTLNPDDPELIALGKQAIALQTISRPTKTKQPITRQIIKATIPAETAPANHTGIKKAPPVKTTTRQNHILRRNQPSVANNSSKFTISSSPAKTSNPSKSEKNSPQLQQAIDAYQNLQYAKAFELLQPLVKKHIPRAMFRSGMMLMGGKGIERDRISALNQLEMVLPSITQRSLQSESWAQVALGLYFDNGWLMQSNAEAAVALYRKAATAGNTDAMNNLGLMYASGRGVEENFTTAKSWLLRARDSGHKIAAINLGKLELLIQNRTKRKQQDPADFSGN